MARKDQSENRRAYKEAHREEARLYARTHYQAHKAEAIAYAKEYREKNSEKRSAWQRAYRQALRTEVITAYGGKCSCCGEIEQKFLSIDHINGGGAKHKRDIEADLYAWLKANNYPPGFQVLCFNCNLAKGFYGVCPHQLNQGNGGLP
jgi:hypothetical protein